MTIEFGTDTPVEINPGPSIERDRWSVGQIQILPRQNIVAVKMVSALMDGGIPKDRKDFRMHLTWSEISSFPVGTATTLGQAIADMIESKAKARNLLPNEASQI